VPQLVGLPLDEAVTALEKAGLKTGSVTEEITGKVLGGIVRLQNPDADSELEGGKLVPVDLVVEAFSVEVPGLKNKTVVQAEEELVGAGLTLGEVTEKRTGNAPGGTVLDSKPSPGERAPPGTAVAVTVETKSMLVPSVTGQTLSEASNTLETLGLRVGKIDQRQTGAQGGVVLSQVPVPGSQAPPGTAIALVVERQTVAVPNVTRKTLTQAMRELGAINLRVAVIKTRTGRNRPGVVFQQSPAVNAKVAPGSTVNLNVEDQPPPPPRVQSQGQIAIAQTWTADLDTGKTGNSADADIWFQAQTALVRFVTPRNGAQIAKGGKSPVGVTGCQQAKLSTASILINSLPAGTYVCARTNKGQYSEFRVVSTVGRTLKISYTTWGMPSGNQIVNFPTTIHIVPALQQLKLLQRSLAPAE
jgi:beta-lactam-binding protein with PASTA domain